MRLTLRTLLAYLDDRLPSSDAREIGKKITDSPFAQELADRIRTVIRQRRLSTPGRKVKLIDPNLIAEYLDDQLTPELVALVEKEVLSSDFSLAEVASSHEVLGLLGDPIQVEDGLRKRLVGLNPHRSAEESTDHELEQIQSGDPTDENKEIWQPLAPQRSFSPKSPALIITLLIVLWVVVFVSDSVRTHRESSVAMNAEGVGPDDGAAVPVPPDSDDGTPDADGQQEVSVDSADSGQETTSASGSPEIKSDADEPTSEESIEDLSAEKPTENETADTGTDPSSNDDVSTKDGSAVNDSVTVASADPVSEDTDTPAKAGETDSTTDSAATPATDEPAPSVDAVGPADRRYREFKFAVESPADMLLYRKSAGSQWHPTAVVQRGRADWHDVLTSGVTAISPPFTAEVTPQKAGWMATLVAPALVRFADGTAPGIRLYDGRCVLQRHELLEDNERSETTLLLGPLEIPCSLTGPGTKLGIAVHAIPPDGEPADAGTDRLPLDNDLSVKLFVVGGSVSFHVPGDDAIVLGNGRAMSLIVRAGAVEGISVSPANRADAIQEWVHNSGAGPVQPVRRAMASLAKNLQQTDDLLDAALEQTDQRSSVASSYAAEILAVCRDAEGLSRLLSSSHESVRVVAFQGLRKTAAQSFAGREAVSRAIEIQLPANILGDTARLLKGISTAEAENPAVGEWLVGLLNHDRVEVRQMAITTLEEMTGERQSYHPDSDRKKRREAVGRWERYLQNNNGRLIPAG